MGLINCTGCTHMLYTQTKPIADADSLTWQFFFFLLSFTHFSDIFLSLKSVEFREKSLGIEEGQMRIIPRWEVWKLGGHVDGKPWMKSRHGGLVHLSPEIMQQ